MRGRRVLLALAALLGAPACESELEPAAPSPPPVADPFGGGLCAACVEAACQPEVAACASDPECATFWSCVRACPVLESGNVDPACVAACPAADDSGAARLVGDLESCRNQGLGATCSLCGAESRIDGQVCGPSDEEYVCFRCEDEKCCDVEAECNADAECKAYIACLKSCSSCQDACVAAHPAGVAKSTPVLACTVKHCHSFAPECDLSRVDDCARCAYLDCIDTWVRLNLDPFGYRLAECFRLAASAEERDACIARYPTAELLLRDYAECVAERCVEAC
jgi:hypothetical protein